MPYIKQENRAALDAIVNQAVSTISVDGDLNYLVTRIVRELLMKRGVNYQNMQNLDGCLGQIQAEFRRRIIGPYEDLKIKQNGDVDQLASLIAMDMLKLHGY